MHPGGDGGGPPFGWRPPPALGQRLKQIRAAAVTAGAAVAAQAQQAGAALAAARAAHLAQQAAARAAAEQEASLAASLAPPVVALEGVPALQLHAPGSAAAETPPPEPPARRDPGARLAAFRAALAPPAADVAALRTLALASGVPDDAQPGMRLAVWQLLLAALPPDPAAWPAARAAQRRAYARLVAELVVDPSKAAAAAPVEQDHPLALDSGASAWARHFAHAETREQIARDVDRTQRDLNFFSGGEAAEAHRAAIARALFVFAATNATVRYVQGMNELMAGLYYVAATSPAAAADDEEHAADYAVPYGPPVGAAEAAAFACFVPMLAELRDLFCASLDGSAGGVAGAMAALSALLAEADAELAAALVARGVNPQFFAFRWITTALTQVCR
jgi:hypothetical protein